MTFLSDKRTKAVLVVAALVLTAGCMGLITGDSTDPVDQVPDDADFLIHGEAQVMEDDETQELIDGVAGDAVAADGVDDFKDEFEQETDLNPEEVSEVMVFGDIESTEPHQEDEGGLIAHTEWDEEEVISAIEDLENTEYERVDHEGEDVLYQPVEDPAFGQPLYVGVLDDGQFVMGTEEMVTGSLDVVYGDADPVSGSVVDAYNGVEDGHVTFAAEIPEDQVPDDDMVESDVNFSAFEEVDAVAGSYYTGSGDLGFELMFVAETAESGEDVYDTIDASITLIEQMESEEDEEFELFVEQLENVEVNHDGSNVYVTYENSVDNVLDFFEELGVMDYPAQQPI